ncbi:MAG: hypothetical protein RR588_00375 [Solibacillus sp.]
MKNRRDILINVLIIVLSITAVTTYVVILSGSVFYFYKGSDTLIAGIIAFTGAIIGGFITLLGVRHTILNQVRKEEEKKNIAKKRLIRLLEYTYKMVDSVPSLECNFEISVIVYDPKWGEYLGEMDFIDDSDVRTIVAWLTTMTKLEQMPKSGNGTLKGYVIYGHTKFIKDKILEIINKYK